jgi:hypothetical protein
MAVVCLTSLRTTLVCKRPTPGMVESFSTSRRSRLGRSGAGQVMALEHLGQLLGGLAKRAQPVAMMGLHGDMHKAHQVLAQQLAVEQGNHALHVALALETLDALMDRRP